MPVHTMLQICCDLQKTVAFLQRDSKFVISVLTQSIVYWQLIVSRLNRPYLREYQHWQFCAKMAKLSKDTIFFPLASYLHDEREKSISLIKSLFPQFLGMIWNVRTKPKWHLLCIKSLHNTTPFWKKNDMKNKFQTSVFNGSSPASFVFICSLFVKN